MSKMIETLKNNGWEMSTIGQCQLGDEVLTRCDNKANIYTTVCGEHECEGFTVTEDGLFPEWTPVLRSPREGWDDIDDPNEVPHGVAV